VIFLSSDHHKSDNTARCCQCFGSKSSRKSESLTHEDNYEKEEENITQTKYEQKKQQEEQQQVHHQQKLEHYNKAQHEMKVNQLFFILIFTSFTSFIIRINIKPVMNLF
jgi:hypothetical protein